jgi:hypothetical protein
MAFSHDCGSPFTAIRGPPMRTGFPETAFRAAIWFSFPVDQLENKPCLL